MSSYVEKAVVATKAAFPGLVAVDIVFPSRTLGVSQYLQLHNDAFHRVRGLCVWPFFTTPPLGQPHAIFDN